MLTTMRPVVALIPVACALGACQQLLDFGPLPGGAGQDASTVDASSDVGAVDGAVDGATFGKVVTIASGQDVTRLGADATHVFWFPADGRALYRLPLDPAGDASAPVVLYDAQAIVTQPGLVVDRDTAFFVSNPNCDHIHAVSLAGKDVTYDTISCENVLQFSVSATAVGFIPGTKAIYLQPRPGGTSATRIPDAAVSSPGPMAVGADAVYVVEGQRIVGYAPVSGQSFTIADGQNAPVGLAIDGDRLFWVTVDGRVMTALGSPSDAGAPSASMIGQAGEAVRMAANDEWVVWADPKGSVRAVRKRGGPDVVIAGGQGGLADVAASARGAFWATSDGFIRMAPLE